MNDCDVAIIGAGIAGAGVAYALLSRAPGLRVALIEAERLPGYHTTGRSAAFFAEAYGGPGVRPLSTWSRSFLESPPADFSAAPFLSKRGALHLQPPGRADLLGPLQRLFDEATIPFARLDARALGEAAPCLRPPWRHGAIWEPGCADIDVGGLHQAYLGAARRLGARLFPEARVAQASFSQDGWAIVAPGLHLRANILVNAAGAWADDVATLAGVDPLGLQPMRRTVVVVSTRPPAAPSLPLVMDAGGSFYFRPDGDRLWLSPHDETPVPPQDVQPEEDDVALTLARFEAATTFTCERVWRKWAGLRTFAPDRLPVVGFDPAQPGFFWLAGQGGWGIQTAPAMSALAATAILGEAPPAGLDDALYHPRRFR